MTISLKKAAIAIAIGLGTLGSVPATASATSVDFYFGTGGSGIHIHDGYRDRGRWGHDRRHWGRDRWNRGCSARRAVRIARHDFGLRRAHVAREGHRRIVVEGRRHHRWQRIVFANVRGCPVIRY